MITQDASGSPGRPSRSPSTSPIIPSCTGSSSTTTHHCVSRIPDLISTSPCVPIDRRCTASTSATSRWRTPIAPVGSNSPGHERQFGRSSTHSHRLPSLRSWPPSRPDNSPRSCGIGQRRGGPMPSLLLLTLTSRCATKSPKPSTENAGDRDESGICRGRWPMSPAPMR